MQEEIMYTSSDGTKTPIKDVETTHLSYALAKAYRDIYTAKDDKEFDEYVGKINTIKNELHKRINDFKEGKTKNE